MSVDEISEYLNLTALFRNQWGFRPENGEDDPAFKDRVRADAARAAGQGEGGVAPRAPGRLGPLRRGLRGQRPHPLRATTRARPSSPASPSRANDVAPFLCIADFFRSVESSRPRLREFHARHHGLARLRALSGALQREPLHRLPHAPRARRRNGRGARRDVAQANPRRNSATSKRTARRSLGCSASSIAVVATRGAIRPVPTSPTTRRSPNCSRANASASPSRRASSSTPSRRPTRSSATTRWRSTSSPEVGPPDR